MSNIVYFLGAGASALALPSVDGMKVEIENQKAILESYLEGNFNAEAFRSLPISFRENYSQLMRLKGNVKAITWNYDIQLELSLKRYLNKKSMS
jgi:hypothetical protein